MTSHVFIVTQENCPVCKQAIKDLPDIDNNVEFVEISSDKGQDISKQLVITKVPTCVVGIEDGGNTKYEYCDDVEKQKQFD